MRSFTDRVGNIVQPGQRIAQKSGTQSSSEIESSASPICVLMGDSPSLSHRLELPSPHAAGRAALLKSGHRSSFLLPDADISRPSSPSHGSSSPKDADTKDEHYALNGVVLPLEIMKKIMDWLGKRERRKVRETCRQLENLVGASFLSTPLPGSGVERFLSSGSRYLSEVEDVIVPAYPEEGFGWRMPRLQKVNFSSVNAYYFSRMRSEEFPRLRKVTFQGVAGVAFKAEHLPATLEDVVFWGSGDSSDSVEKQLLDEVTRHVRLLKTLEVWSARQHPEVFVNNLQNSLTRVRFMGGVMLSTISYALHHITKSCPNLEELVMTCKPIAPINEADFFEMQSSSAASTSSSANNDSQNKNPPSPTTSSPHATTTSHVLVEHQKLAKLRIRHSFVKVLKLNLPSLTRLTLEGQQRNAISIASNCTRLAKLSLEASPNVLAHLFMKPMPNLTVARIVIIPGMAPKSSSIMSPKIRTPGSEEDGEPIAPTHQNTGTQRSLTAEDGYTAHVDREEASSRSKFSFIVSSPSMSSLADAASDASSDMPTNSNPSSILGDKALEGSGSHATLHPVQLPAFASSYTPVPTSPSSRQNRHSSVRSSHEISLSIRSSTLKKMDLRIQTTASSYPKLRELVLDAPHLEAFTFQIHPLAVPPRDLHLQCPSLTTLSTCLHPALLDEMMPNFERFGSALKKLFVTLQDEDVAQVSRAIEPYLAWKLPHVHALGLSNISILTRLTIHSQTMHTLLLENMHTIPHFLLQDLDAYLPNLKHLEIKAPEMEENAHEEEAALSLRKSHGDGSALAGSPTNLDLGDENPYFLQKEYRALCPKERVTIRSSSLRSLVYTLELPHHPILELPHLKELFYLQQNNTNVLDLQQLLEKVPRLETGYVGVASVRNCHVVGEKLKKLKIVFGFVAQRWSVKAARLEKLKILRIRMDPVPIALSFSAVHAPNLKRLELCGVVIDEASQDRMPENCFLEIRSTTFVDDDTDEEYDGEEHYYEHSYQMIGSQDY